MIEIVKNRKREKYTFANINLLGNCNADCYFCLGKDILQELAGKNQLNIHFSKWKNFEYFLQGFIVGVRTNGYLAETKMDCIHKMDGEIGFH